MTKTHRLFLWAAAAVVALPALAQQKATPLVPGPVKAADIKQHIAVLAADSLMGRKPFGPGEPKATRYIASVFKQLGLQPGNKGSYYQQVPMVQIVSKPTDSLLVTGANTHIALKFKDDFVALSRREQDTLQLKNSPLVFAGYGIVAPEYHWNDYAGLDVKGKTVIVLVNDPGFKSGNPKLFKGDTMTYYGRWTYKYEEAARQGAAGVIIIHQTDAASYGWAVVKNSNTNGKLFLQEADKHMSRCKMEAWITEAAATSILQAAGITGDLRALARTPGFKPISLNLSLTVGISNTMKYAESKNVIAVLKGASHPQQNIVYTAHWDHLGVGPAVNGDSIYNGAIDNASGVAALLSIAKAYAGQKAKPQRSVVFLAVTAEEQGLLGSEYYATHPVFALQKTIANLNMDALGDYGETTDIAITGKGQNDLDDYMAALAKLHKLTLAGDITPSAGSYYRSDHFNFAKVGVPALDMNSGINSATYPAGWAKQHKDEYGVNRYHQVTDNYSPNMDVSGMAEVANLFYLLGKQLANSTAMPGWKAGSEFKAIREASLKSNK